MLSPELLRLRESVYVDSLTCLVTPDLFGCSRGGEELSRSALSRDLDPVPVPSKVAR